MTAVELLRQQAEAPPSISDAALRRLLNTVNGDVDLAATALCMRPRPRWVHELITAPKSV